MPVTIDSYVDNQTRVVQVSNWAVEVGAGKPAGSNMHTFLSPRDVPNLSGTAKVFVNKVRFEFQGIVVNGGVGESYGFMTCSILPYDIASAIGTNMPIWSDYDDVRGWPINMGKRFYFAYAGDTANSRNGIRMVLTYSPRKALIINREQALFLNIYNAYGQPITGHLSICASLKRGDG